MKTRAKKLLAAAAAVGLVATLSSVVDDQAASAAPARGGPTITLLTGTGSVTTADKHKWTLQVAYFDVEGSGGLTVGIKRSISKAGGGYEAHTWSLPVSGSPLSFSSKSGDGTLNTGKGADPLASLDLSFVGKAPTKTTCQTGTDALYPGSLSGKLSLKTGLKGGGTIGSSSLKFTTASVEVGAGCDPGADQPCVPGIAYSGFKGESLDTDGYSNESNKSALLNVGKNVNLSAPFGAFRSDEGGLMTGALPVFDAKAKTLTVKTESSGAFTGSAVLTGKKEGTHTSVCKIGTKKYTLTDTSYEATLTSPKSSPLTAHTTLTGNIAMPASVKNAFFDITTRK